MFSILCQRADFYYDSNPFDGTISQNAWARRTAEVFKASCTASQTVTFTQMYGYTTGGLVTKKRLRAERLFSDSTVYRAELEAGYTYNDEGRALTVTYPSTFDPNTYNPLPGLTYTTTYESMGRPLSLRPSNDNRDLASGAQYGPAGELARMEYGGFTETRTYNSLLQLTRLQDSYNYAGYNYNTDFEYRYAAGQNNGRIAQAKDWITGEEVSYTYDALNRLIGAATTGPEWGQSYTYDGFGNLRAKTVTKGTATTFSVSINGATNRMAGVQYDASGNQLATVAQPWNPVYQYDGENRLVGTAGQAYGYDPENRRVWKRPTEGAQTETVYFYGADGALLGSYNWSVYGFTQAGTNVYFGGRMIPNRGGTLLAERLGSMRMDFGVAPAVRLSYLPYGEERQTSAPERMKFATYFRDDTGLDYAMQRYYSSVQGRFLTPDPYRATARSVNNPEDPQSWNRYAYVLNDPINFNDPKGLYAAWFEYDSGGSGWWGPYSLPMWGPEGYIGSLPIFPGGTPPVPNPIFTGGAALIPQDRDLLPAALSRALQALSLNRDCLKLFGTDKTRANGFDPMEVLSSIVTTGKFGEIRFENKGKDWGVAETRPAGPFPASLGRSA